MANEAAYCCAGLLFLVLIVFFAVSMRTNSQTRKYCQWTDDKFEQLFRITPSICKNCTTSELTDLMEGGYSKGYMAAAWQAVVNCQTMGECCKPDPTKTCTRSLTR